MIQGVLRELAPQFPEELLHVGQDEVDVGCWSSAQNPTIGEWQKKCHFSTPDEAYVSVANRIERGVRALNKRAVQWWPGLCLGAPTGNRSCGKPSGFCPCRGVVPGQLSGGTEKPGLDTATILQLWSGPGRLDWNDTVAQVVAAGYSVIQSQGWYLPPPANNQSLYRQTLKMIHLAVILRTFPSAPSFRTKKHDQFDRNFTYISISAKFQDESHSLTWPE